MTSTSDKRERNSEPLLIALGNRFRGDDGVGHQVAEMLRERQAACRIVANQDDSMALINAWEDASLAIIVDASQSGANPGTIVEIDAGTQPIPHELARCSSHGVGLAEAVELGKILNLLPTRLIVYAIEAEHFDAGEPLSESVSEAVDTVTTMIESQLTQIPIADNTQSQDLSKPGSPPCTKHH